MPVPVQVSLEPGRRVFARAASLGAGTNLIDELVLQTFDVGSAARCTRYVTAGQAAPANRATVYFVTPADVTIWNLRFRVHFNGAGAFADVGRIGTVADDAVSGLSTVIFGRGAVTVREDDVAAAVSNGAFFPRAESGSEVLFPKVPEVGGRTFAIQGPTGVGMLVSATWEENEA